MCKHMKKMLGFKKLHVKGRSHGGPHKQGHNGKLRHCEKHGFGHHHVRSHGEVHFGHHNACSHIHRPHGKGQVGHLGHHRVRSHNRGHHGEGHFGHLRHHHVCSHGHRPHGEGHFGRKRGHKGHCGGRPHRNEGVEENREVAIVEIEEPQEIGTQMALLTL